MARNGPQRGGNQRWNGEAWGGRIGGNPARNDAHGEQPVGRRRRRELNALAVLENDPSDEEVEGQEEAVNRMIAAEQRDLARETAADRGVEAHVLYPERLHRERAFEVGVRQEVVNALVPQAGQRSVRGGAGMRLQTAVTPEGHVYHDVTGPAQPRVEDDEQRWRELRRVPEVRGPNGFPRPGREEYSNGVLRALQAGPRGTARSSSDEDERPAGDGQAPDETVTERAGTQARRWVQIQQHGRWEPGQATAIYEREERAETAWMRTRPGGRDGKGKGKGKPCARDGSPWQRPPAEPGRRMPGWEDLLPGNRADMETVQEGPERFAQQKARRQTAYLSREGLLALDGEQKARPFEMLSASQGGLEVNRFACAAEVIAGQRSTLLQLEQERDRQDGEAGMQSAMIALAISQRERARLAELERRERDGGALATPERPPSEVANKETEIPKLGTKSEAGAQTEPHMTMQDVKLAAVYQRVEQVAWLRQGGRLVETRTAHGLEETTTEEYRTVEDDFGHSAREYVPDVENVQANITQRLRAEGYPELQVVNRDNLGLNAPLPEGRDDLQTVLEDQAELEELLRLRGAEQERAESGAQKQQTEPVIILDPSRYRFCEGKNGGRPRVRQKSGVKKQTRISRLQDQILEMQEQVKETTFSDGRREKLVTRTASYYERVEMHQESGGGGFEDDDWQRQSLNAYGAWQKKRAAPAVPKWGTAAAKQEKASERDTDDGWQPTEVPPDVHPRAKVLSRTQRQSWGRSRTPHEGHYEAWLREGRPNSEEWWQRQPPLEDYDERWWSEPPVQVESDERWRQSQAWGEPSAQAEADEWRSQSQTWSDAANNNADNRDQRREYDPRSANNRRPQE